MSPVATARSVTLAVLAALTVGPATAAAPTVSVSELAHCAAIVAVDQRLACYDTLAVAKMPPPAAPAAAVAAVPAAAATGSAGAAAPAAAAAGGFGMSTHVAPPEQSTQAITAHVVAASADRQGNTFVSLDNGQTWTYVDVFGPPETGSEVTIRRAALGSFLITTSTHHTYRAQRTK